ncbi:hypothetical protein OG566_00615 [Streptomyces sp. NBC_01353]
MSNPGDQETHPDGTRMTDTLPAGLTGTSLALFGNSTGGTVSCFLNDVGTRVECETVGSIDPEGSYTLEVTISVATDAPCTVTNTATVIEPQGSLSASASDTVNIPGPNCNGGNGTSILPISLSGLIPIYNNINTNNNINSPGASNTNSQNFRVNAP